MIFVGYRMDRFQKAKESEPPVVYTVQVVSVLFSRIVDLSPSIAQIRGAKLGKIQGGGVADLTKGGYKKVLIFTR